MDESTSIVIALSYAANVYHYPVSTMFAAGYATPGRSQGHCSESAFPALLLTGIRDGVGDQRGSNNHLFPGKRALFWVGSLSTCFWIYHSSYTAGPRPPLPDPLTHASLFYHSSSLGDLVDHYRDPDLIGDELPVALLTPVDPEASE